MTKDAGMILRHRVGDRLNLILNRPRVRNALHPEMLRDLVGAIQHACVDDEVTTIWIEGAGDAAFSAGFDIRVLQALPGGSGTPFVAAAVDAVTNCSKPTIAVIRGWCLGAGLELALACDLRIAEESARFAMPVLRIGNVYEPRAIARFVGALGPDVTEELFVFGRVFTAAEALRVGILQGIFPPGDPALTLAKWADIPAQGIEASRSHKRIIRALAANRPRDNAFWAELDDLRARSLASSQRRSALQQADR